MDKRIQFGDLVAREVAANTIQVISENRWPEVSCLYFSLQGEEIIQIGVQPAFSQNEVFRILDRYKDHRLLSTVVTFEMNQEALAALSDLNEVGQALKVIWNQPNLNFKTDVFPNLNFQSLADINYHLVLSNKNVFRFMPAPFIIHDDSFMVFDPTEGILFANYLFDKGINSPASTDPKQEMIGYQRRKIPSSNFLTPVLGQLQALDLRQALSRTGQSYLGQELTDAISALDRLEFHNSYRSLDTDGTSMEDQQYVTLLNQAIGKLRALFPDEEIKASFVNSSLPFNPETMTFDADQTVKAVKLWHLAFEMIYLRKGAKWLSALEPFVNRIQELQGIPKPNIYGSLVMNSEQEIVMLGKEKQQLESELASLKVNLDKTTEKLLKDSLTGNYNETFLKEFLMGEIGKFGSDHANLKEISLIYLSVDNILGINAKYSKEVGDETLINVAYLLGEIKMEHDLIFKRNGPGFILFLGDAMDRDIYDVASKIQSTIAKADIFIEPITVSLAIVQMSEFLGLQTNEEIVDNMLATGQNRIKLVHLKGANSLVDRNVKTENLVKGSILVADDEEIQLKLIGAFFRKANFEVYPARDGKAALEIAKSVPMDAFVVSKNIPKIDGLTLKNLLNDSTFTMNTPFILLTYNKTPDTIARSNRLGIDYVMQKPLIYDEMLGIIKRFKQKRSA